jgi:hypothetical protein
VGKAEEKRPLGRPRCRRVDNIKIDFVEIGYRGVGLYGLAQNRDKCRDLVNAVNNFRVPQNAGKPSSGYTAGGISSIAQSQRVSQGHGTTEPAVRVNACNGYWS